MASQRFRFEQYLPALKNAGFEVDIKSFFTTDEWMKMRESRSVMPKIMTLLAASLRRIAIIPAVRKKDFVFIHREAFPVGPAIIEWVIGSLFRKRIIYDFDDAIWLTDNSRENIIIKALRWRTKIADICRVSYKVSCGNEYLAKYARQFCNQVSVVPTTIELTHHVIEEKSADQVKTTIGWTGSHSTIKYFIELTPVLQKIAQRHPSVEFMVIADQKPETDLSPLIFKRWSAETEIADLNLVDIGIMPLPDNKWTQGKCGFKALQYMALAIPTVAAPVGVNNDIIKNGVNGLLAKTTDEWLSQLEVLITDRELRSKLGIEGRKTIEKAYSVEANEARFLSLFQ